MKAMMKGLALATAVTLLLTTSAQATMLAWYRMGDDDGSMAVNGGPIGPDASNKSANHLGGSLDGLYINSGQPLYSTDVPGTGTFTPPKIYDPLSDTTLSNAWSMYAPGTDPTERLRPGSVAVPTTFTFEAFVQPVTGTAATGTLAFAYHRSGATGGWALTRNSNGSLQVDLYAGSVLTNTLTTAEAGLLPNGEWHHVAVVYENRPNEDGNDLFLYVDHALKASGNGTVTPSGSTTFYVGNATSSSAKKIFMDEVRYFDNSVNPVTNPADFLQVVPEPNSMILVTMGTMGAFAFCRRRKKASSK